MAAAASAASATQNKELEDGRGFEIERVVLGMMLVPNIDDNNNGHKQWPHLVHEVSLRRIKRDWLHNSEYERKESPDMCMMTNANVFCRDNKNNFARQMALRETWPSGFEHWTTWNEDYSRGSIVSIEQLAEIKAAEQTAQDEHNAKMANNKYLGYYKTKPIHLLRLESSQANFLRDVAQQLPHDPLILSGLFFWCFTNISRLLFDETFDMDA